MSCKTSGECAAAFRYDTHKACSRKVSRAAISKYVVLLLLEKLLTVNSLEEIVVALEETSKLTESKNEKRKELQKIAALKKSWLSKRRANSQRVKMKSERSCRK